MLDSRLYRYDEVVRSLLSNSGSAAKDSPFLRKFKEKVRSGRKRTLLQADSFMVPGYYGPRGTRRILEFVTRRFHIEIGRWAVENELVSVRGKMPFLESVVIPELAVRLVMEDMAVGREKTDRILQDSRDVGKLLNEDDDDVVDDSDEDEGEYGGNLR